MACRQQVLIFGIFKVFKAILLTITFPKEHLKILRRKYALHFLIQSLSPQIFKEKSRDRIKK